MNTASKNKQDAHSSFATCLFPLSTWVYNLLLLKLRRPQLRDKGWTTHLHTCSAPLPLLGPYPGLWEGNIPAGHWERGLAEFATLSLLVFGEAFGLIVFVWLLGLCNLQLGESKAVNGWWCLFWLLLVSPCSPGWSFMNIFSACVLHTCVVLSEESVRSPETVVTSCWELPCGC